MNDSCVSQLVELIAASYTGNKVSYKENKTKDDIALLILLSSLQSLWWGEYAEFQSCMVLKKMMGRRKNKLLTKIEGESSTVKVGRLRF